MAFVWADPAGSATGGTQFWDTIAGAVSAQTSVLLNSQPYTYLFSTGAGPASATARKNAVVAAAGRRISQVVQFPVLPSNDSGLRPLTINPTAGSGNHMLAIVIDSAGKLRLYTSGGTVQIGATGSSVLAVNTPYRLTLSYTITTTTNWSAKVYIDGVLEMTRTNADATLTSAAVADFNVTVGASLGANFLFYMGDLYIDDIADQSDPGNVHVKATLPTTVSSGSWDTTNGTGAVNERPLSTTNGVAELATGPATLVYNLQGAAVGDADITNATILGRMGWIWAKLSTLTGTPTGKVQIDGVANATAWDPAVADTYQLFTTIDSLTTVPATVGVSSSGIAADSTLAELGAVVAYLPGLHAVGVPFGMHGQSQMRQLLAQ